MGNNIQNVHGNGLTNKNSLSCDISSILYVTHFKFIREYSGYLPTLILFPSSHDLPMINRNKISSKAFLWSTIMRYSKFIIFYWYKFIRDSCNFLFKIEVQKIICIYLKIYRNSWHYKNVISSIKCSDSTSIWVKNELHLFGKNQQLLKILKTIGIYCLQILKAGWHSKREVNWWIKTTSDQIGCHLDPEVLLHLLRELDP